MSQNLHRAGKRPQWEETPDLKRNAWQRMAAKTNGVVTPGNAVTMLGFAVVASGLNDIRSGDRLKGVSKIVAGRACDLVDGAIAEWSKTKSPLGEALDAGIDKVEMAAALVMLGSSKEIPSHAVTIIGARDAAMWALTGIARSRKVITHPSLAGKHATFAQWGSLTGFALENVTRDAGLNGLSTTFNAIGQISLAAMTLLGAESIATLAQEAVAPRTEENSL